MAIVNRDLDPSQQRDTIQSDFGVVATGVTMQIALIPSSGNIQAVKVSALGLSGSPTYDLRVWRFIAGAGATTIAGGATTLTPLTNGTSGIASMVLAATGSSLLQVQAGDVITLTSGVANTAASIATALVVQYTQDIRTQFGI